MNGEVHALAVSGNDLYAGGLFSTAGGSAATNIAKWNGSIWSALGSGMNGEVRGLAVSSGDLYAGGGFTAAGGGAANRVAKWNGNTWSGLGSGMNRDVRALAVSGGDLYAVGEFTTAGGKVSASVTRAELNALALTSPHVADDQIMFQVCGDVGSNYSVEATASLSPADWIPVLTNAGTFWFSNSIAGPQKYYRAVSLP
jgi:hypothetical protein